MQYLLAYWLARPQRHILHICRNMTMSTLTRTWLRYYCTFILTSLTEKENGKSLFFFPFFFFFGKRKSYSIRVRYTFGHSSKMLPCIWVHFWIGCIVLLFLQLGAARTKICGTIFTTVTCFNTELG